jgi:hypothetical protein
VDYVRTFGGDAFNFISELLGVLNGTALRNYTYRPENPLGCGFILRNLLATIYSAKESV